MKTMSDRVTAFLNQFGKPLLWAGLNSYPVVVASHGVGWIILCDLHTRQCAKLRGYAGKYGV